MNGSEILSNIIVHNKYARFLPEKNRRENWEELIQRNMDMHLSKYPEQSTIISNAYNDVFDKNILPSMRSLQFAGRAIEKNNSRIYNCSYIPIKDAYSFSEVIFLLLGGTGVGYSVQKHHIENLPAITIPNKTKKFLVGDSLEGWADAIFALMKAYFHNSRRPIFDFSDIRDKGVRLVTAGGKAPGPEPLKKCIEKLENIFGRKKEGERLSDIEVHDMVCHIANAVLAGGIRRSALICLFDKDSDAMMNCKSGEWWVDNEQRGRANNSAVFLRDETTEEQFNTVFNALKDSMAGEPGFYFTNNKDLGTNPCCEISLYPYQFCNLVDVSVNEVDDNEELFRRVRNAAIISTIQASYTDFHFLRDSWKDTTEAQALIGVGLTGISGCDYKKLDFKRAAEIVKETNEDISKLIGINPSARCTTIKPAGTTSIVLKTSSGVHAWHDDVYVRRIRCLKNDNMYSYMKKTNPHLVEDDFFDSKGNSVISIPIKAPDGALTRSESSLDFLERVKWFNENWIIPGHRYGDNYNNVSATVNVRDSEWEEVRTWMWENRGSYNGISILPYDGGSYIQAPFETIEYSSYNEMTKKMSEINLDDVLEYEDNSELSSEIACGGGSCEINQI